MDSASQHNHNAKLSAENGLNSIMEYLTVNYDASGIDMNASSGARLTGVALDQFLFFTNQVAFPILSLSKLAAPSESIQKKRTEFLASYSRLLLDLQTALNTLELSTPSVLHRRSGRDAVRIAVSLDNITMPGCRGIMLFQYPNHTGKDLGHKPKNGVSSANGFPERTLSPPNGPDLGNDDYSLDDVPPDSDSDVDSSTSRSGPNSPPQLNGLHKPTTQALPLNPKTLPRSPLQTLSDAQLTPSSLSFTPFTDPSSESDEEHKPTKLQKLPLRSNPPTMSKKSGLTVRHAFSSDALSQNKTPPNGIMNETANSKALKKLEKDIVVGMSNFDMFTEDNELSRVSIYLYLPSISPATFEIEGWHPRQAIVKSVDAMFQYPDIDGIMKKKVERMKGKICKISLCSATGKPLSSHTEDTESQETNGAADGEESGIWLEWDGKLNGVE